MKDLSKLQDKVEEKARENILKELSNLEREYRELINKYNHITGDVSIRVQDMNAKISAPYLSQIFISEAVIERIMEQCLPNYVNSLISKILER